MFTVKAQDAFPVLIRHSETLSCKNAPIEVNFSCVMDLNSTSFLFMTWDREGGSTLFTETRSNSTIGPNYTGRIVNATFFHDDAAGKTTHSIVMTDVIMADVGRYQCSATRDGDHKASANWTTVSFESKFHSSLDQILDCDFLKYLLILQYGREALKMSFLGGFYFQIICIQGAIS